MVENEELQNLLKELQNFISMWVINRERTRPLYTRKELDAAIFSLNDNLAHYLTSQMVLSFED